MENIQFAICVVGNGMDVVLTETSSVEMSNSSLCGSFCISVLFLDIKLSKSIGSTATGLFCNENWEKRI